MWPPSGSGAQGPTRALAAPLPRKGVQTAGFHAARTPPVEPSIRFVEQGCLIVAGRKLRIGLFEQRQVVQENFVFVAERCASSLCISPRRARDLDGRERQGPICANRKEKSGRSRRRPCEWAVPKASPGSLERPRAMLWRVPTQERNRACATPVYQRAVCSVAASHRKLGAAF